jgi:valyl-tRNA synthetase
VKFFEKGDRPIEFIATRQWFVRLLEKKTQLLEYGARIGWHPEYMHHRFQNWTEGLQLDWCISRQRYFGVPFPVWYPVLESGSPDYEHPIVASAAELPIDPTIAIPAGFSSTQRDQPGGFTAESDVFDTWFTSSLTPQIASGWQLVPERHSQIFPGDIRPQSHEIIRTWAFYTIAKAMLHEQQIPWRNVLISGWVIDPDRKKMSKSRGNVVTPMHLIDNYGADAVRYWAAVARLGTDTAFDEKIFKIGKRLVTKIFNAGKFVLSQAAEEAPISHELDRGFVAKLRELVEEVSSHYDTFDAATALARTESFFWSTFTDNYIELVKGRARGEGAGVVESSSAVAGLRLGLSVLLRLFAPALPYITDEVWSWVFAAETGAPSIHRAPWPTVAEFLTIAPPSDATILSLSDAALVQIRKHRSQESQGSASRIEYLKLGANPPTLKRFLPIQKDVCFAARCNELALEPRAELAAGTFEVIEARFERQPTERS